MRIQEGTHGAIGGLESRVEASTDRVLTLLASTNTRATFFILGQVAASHPERKNVLEATVSTDTSLALRTRKGTGFYSVPSLRGVWYRGLYEHSGSVKTLEDWFDPRRLRDDYVPTGFRGYGVKTRAVKGHQFGLKLSSDDKQALIRFLRTL